MFKFSHGAWHPVSGTVYWDEFAPMTKVYWENGKKKYHDTPKLDKSSIWFSKPRLMLNKCASAQVIRLGWPQDCQTVYVAEEVDKMVSDITAVEQLQEYTQKKRQALAGGETIPFDMMDGKVTYIALDDIHGKVMDFINENQKEVNTILAWRDLNSENLKQYWIKKKEECLDIKRAIEALTKNN